MSLQPYELTALCPYSLMPLLMVLVLVGLMSLQPYDLTATDSPMTLQPYDLIDSTGGGWPCVGLEPYELTATDSPMTLQPYDPH